MSKSTIAVSFANSWHNIEMSVRRMSIYIFGPHTAYCKIRYRRPYYITYKTILTLCYQQIEIHTLNLYHVYGFIWWSLNLNCAFLTKIETNLEVHMIKIIYLAMGSELSRKIHSSLHNHTRNSHKPGQSCNVFYGTEMIL